MCYYYLWAYVCVYMYEAAEQAAPCQGSGKGFPEHAGGP